MDYKNLIAIDIHTHAEVSCWDFEDAGFKPEVMAGILKGNAVRLLGLEQAAT